MGRPGDARPRWEANTRVSDGKAFHSAVKMGRHCLTRGKWKCSDTRVSDGKVLHGAVQMGKRMMCAHQMGKP